jgi:excisionase family DNA binding protein
MHNDTTTTTKTSPWLTLPEAAAYARVSQPTIRREARAGRLAAYKVGGRRMWRFRAVDLDAWLTESTTPERAR